MGHEDKMDLKSDQTQQHLQYMDIHSQQTQIISHSTAPVFGFLPAFDRPFTSEEREMLSRNSATSIFVEHYLHRPGMPCKVPYVPPTANTRYYRSRYSLYPVINGAICVHRADKLLFRLEFPLALGSLLDIIRPTLPTPTLTKKTTYTHFKSVRRSDGHSSIESIEDPDPDPESDGEFDNRFTGESTVIRYIKEPFKIDNPDCNNCYPESYLDRRYKADCEASALAKGNMQVWLAEQERRKRCAWEKELEKALEWEFEKERATERMKREMKIELDKEKELEKERERKRSLILELERLREAEKKALKETFATRDEYMMMLNDELGDTLDDFYDSKPEKESVTEEMEQDHGFDHPFEPEPEEEKDIEVDSKTTNQTINKEIMCSDPTTPDTTSEDKSSKDQKQGEVEMVWETIYEGPNQYRESYEMRWNERTQAPSRTPMLELLPRRRLVPKTEAHMEENTEENNSEESSEKSEEEIGEAEEEQEERSAKRPRLSY